MKTMIMTLLALGLAVPAAFAEGGTVAPKEKDRPCVRIEKACKDAGFVKGGAKEGKGLFVDCVKPILEWKSVLGVTVDSATRQACQDNIKAKLERDKAKAEADKPKAAEADKPKVEAGNTKPEADKAKVEPDKKKAATGKKKTTAEKSK